MVFRLKNSRLCSILEAFFSYYKEQCSSSYLLRMSEFKDLSKSFTNLSHWKSSRYGPFQLNVLYCLLRHFSTMTHLHSCLQLIYTQLKLDMYKNNSVTQYLLWERPELPRMCASQGPVNRILGVQSDPDILTFWCKMCSHWHLLFS